MKASIHKNFRSQWVLGFVIYYTWISRLLRHAACAFTWRPRELSSWVKKGLISGNLAIWTVHVLEKVLFLCFWVPRGRNSHFCRKTQWQILRLTFMWKYYYLNLGTAYAKGLCYAFRRDWLQHGVSLRAGSRGSAGENWSISARPSREQEIEQRSRETRKLPAVSLCPSSLARVIPRLAWPLHSNLYKFS